MEFANIDIGSIIEQLKHQHAELQSRQVRLKDDLAQVESELTRVEAAIAALHPNGKAKSTKGKPSPKKDQVRDAVRSSLLNGNALNRDELETEVGRQIVAAGCSRSGLALRLAEVLSEPEFNHLLNDTESKSHESQI